MATERTHKEMVQLIQTTQSLRIAAEKIADLSGLPLDKAIDCFANILRPSDIVGSKLIDISILLTGAKSEGFKAGCKFTENCAKKNA